MFRILGESLSLWPGLPTVPPPRPQVSPIAPETCGRAACGVGRPAHNERLRFDTDAQATRATRQLGGQIGTLNSRAIGMNDSRDLRARFVNLASLAKWITVLAAAFVLVPLVTGMSPILQYQWLMWCYVIICLIIAIFSVSWGLLAAKHTDNLLMGLVIAVSTMWSIAFALFNVWSVAAYNFWYSFGAH